MGKKRVIVWRVTQTCNMKCKFCSYSIEVIRQRNDADLEEVERLSNILGKYKQNTGEEMLISFIGGEPLLWEPNLLIKGDIGDSNFCKQVVEQTIKEFGALDILVNNAAEQHVQKNLEDITDEQLLKTFQTNIFSMFYLTRAALPHLNEDSTIINTSSVTAFAGNADLLDYSATKGAITAFTRSLSANLAGKKIRVNQVAPGPIWTPLIPSTLEKSKVESFGDNTPLKRPGQPVELAEAYVFLASDGSTYMTGQTIHINGGTIING